MAQKLNFLWYQHSQRAFSRIYPTPVLSRLTDFESFSDSTALRPPSIPFLFLCSRSTPSFILFGPLVSLHLSSVCCLLILIFSPFLVPPALPSLSPAPVPPSPSSSLPSLSTPSCHSPSSLPPGAAQHHTHSSSRRACALHCRRERPESQLGS